MDGLLADAPDAAGPHSWYDLLDVHVCDAWQLSERFAERPLVTLARPLTEVLSQGRAGDEAVIARRNMRLLADLVQPLTTTSLDHRLSEARENRELGRQLQQRGAVLRLLLLARAATLERGALDPADPNQRPRLAALDADIDHALLAAWSELPGHPAVRAALLERAAALTDEQRWEQGATLLHGALERGRDVPLAAMLGGVFTRLGFLQEAISLLRGARQAGAVEDRSLLLNLGAALLIAGVDDGEAEQVLTRAEALGALPALHAAALAVLRGQEGSAMAARAIAEALGASEPWAATLRRLADASEGEG